MTTPAREIPRLPAVTLWYNPSCGKSQRALAILERCRVEVTLFDYQTTPPNREQVDALLAKLDKDAAFITRAEDEVYTSMSLGTVSEDDLRNALCRYPQLIKGPIGETETRAIVAIPPETVAQVILAIPGEMGEMMDMLRSGLQGKLSPGDG